VIGVFSGQLLGVLGNYSRGDHLHFDMALDPFAWWQYRSPDVHWIDPLPILQAHLDVALVQDMMARKAA